MEFNHSNYFEEDFALTDINEKSFELIYKTHWKSLYNFALLKTNNPEISQEIVQNVFVKIWEKRDSLRILNLKNYLFMVVKNSIIDYYKERLFLEIETASNIPTSEYPIFLDDLEKKFQEEIDKLPPKTKEIFILSRIEGKPISEVSVTLNIPKRTVEYHLAQAISSLKLVFKEFLYLLIVLLTI